MRAPVTLQSLPVEICMCFTLSSLPFKLINTKSGTARRLNFRGIVLPLGLLMLLVGSAHQAEAAPGTWRLPGRLLCLVQSCATFTSSESPPQTLEQGVSDLDLPVDGMLSIPPAGALLEWVKDGQITQFPLSGPALLQLTRQGDVRPIGPIRLQKTGNASGFELGVGPLVISTEGTRFTVIGTASGGACLQVSAGIVRVKFATGADLPPLRLAPHQGVYVSATADRTHPLEVLEGRLLTDQCRTTQAVIEDVEIRGKGSPEALLTRFTRRLPSLSGDALLQEARGLAAAQPTEAVGARALYLAQLKSLATGDMRTADALAAQLKQDFATSPWTTQTEQLRSQAPKAGAVP